MQKAHRTSIDDLNAIGHELSEEHLAIVPGARVRPCSEIIYTNGQVDSFKRD
jgi:hypothetical protein